MTSNIIMYGLGGIRGKNIECKYGMCRALLLYRNSLYRLSLKFLVCFSLLTLFCILFFGFFNGFNACPFIGILRACLIDIKMGVKLSRKWKNVKSYFVGISTCIMEETII